MKAINVRDLNLEEREALEKGLQSSSSFTVRRCQMLLDSADGYKTWEIAERLRCSGETVRTVIHAFQEEGLLCLEKKSSRPHSTRFSFNEEGLSRLVDIVSSSPRGYGLDHSLWSLERLAQVCYEEGLTERPVSIETIRKALGRAGINWKRARKKLQSTDADYELKKNTGMSSFSGHGSILRSCCGGRTNAGSVVSPNPLLTIGVAFA